MDIEEVRQFCLSLPEVTEDMPFGDDTLVFRIGGKIFALQWLGSRPDGHMPIAIKLPPDMGLDLRDRYDAVRPAFHMNKKHWSDVFVEQFSHELVEEWIRISYDLVCKKHHSKKNEALAK